MRPNLALRAGKAKLEELYWKDRLTIKQTAARLGWRLQNQLSPHGERDFAILRQVHELNKRGA